MPRRTSQKREEIRHVAASPDKIHWTQRSLHMRVECATNFDFTLFLPMRSGQPLENVTALNGAWRLPTDMTLARDGPFLLTSEA